MSGGDDDGGDEFWVLVALAALLIPITAVSNSSAPVLAVAAVMVIAAIVLGGRMLMDRRHRHRLAEIEAEAGLAREERLSLAQANQLLDRNSRRAELRDAISQPSPDPVSSNPEDELPA